MSNSLKQMGNEERSVREEIEKSTKDMTSKPCAVRSSFERCSSSCVHFKEGSIKSRSLRLVYELSSCRLWRN